MRTSRKLSRSLATLLIATIVVDPALAWSPPDGPAANVAYTPAPGEYVFKSHGYIIQNGIEALEHDGYWFAADTMRQFQQELLNGVRTADRYLGDHVITVELCVAWRIKCWRVFDDQIPDTWPRGGNRHYYNPSTRRGLNTKGWNEAAYWLQLLALIGVPTLGAVTAEVNVSPSVADEYPSGVEEFEKEYVFAVKTYLAQSIYGEMPSEYPGRAALAMFNLGWASHFVQDLTVVNHTHDAFMPWTHHNDYEDSANGRGHEFRPVADGGTYGIYADDLGSEGCDVASRLCVPLASRETYGIYADDLGGEGCDAASRNCFPLFAARISHDSGRMAAVSGEDYRSVPEAIRFAQALQAGLFAAFLTDVGLRPVHMSAVMASL